MPPGHFLEGEGRTINERNTSVAATTPCVRRFSDSYNQNAARNPEEFHGPRKGERIRRNDAHVTLEVHERFLVETLRIDDGGIDVGEDLDLVGAANVVPVARRAVGYDLVAVRHPDLFGRKRFDHAVRGGHAPDPAVALDAHYVASTVILGNILL